MEKENKNQEENLTLEEKKFRKNLAAELKQTYPLIYNNSWVDDIAPPGYTNIDDVLTYAEINRYLMDKFGSAERAQKEDFEEPGSPEEPQKLYEKKRL